MTKLSFAAVTAFAAVAHVFADGLPAGYTQIPWIESNGKQWIVTDYHLTMNDAKTHVDEKVEAKGQLRSGSVHWQPRVICGAYGSTSSSLNNDSCFALAVCGLTGESTVAELYGYAGQYGYAGNFSNLYADGIDHVFTFNGLTNMIGYDGVEKLCHPNVGSYSKELSPLCILGGKLPGSGVAHNVAPSVPSYFRLYYFKVYNSSNEVVFDAVPVRDDNATVFAKRYGLYDFVGKKFYPNDGVSDPFLVPEGCGLTFTVNRSDYATDAEAGAALVSALANDAKTGDIVKVGPGTYALSATTGPVVIGGGVKMVATDGNPVHTVIDGCNEVNCVTVNDVQDTEKASLAGFTLTRGKATVSGSQVRGGGLLVNRTTAGFSISNCVVSCCRGAVVGDSGGRDAYGVAVYAAGGITMTDVKVENNVMEHNVDTTVQLFPKAVAVYLTQGGVIDRCAFRTNVYDLGTMTYHGWTKWFNAGQVSIVGVAGTVKDSVFEGNYATNRVNKTCVLNANAPDTMPGLYVGVSGTTVERCIFRNGKSGAAAGVVLGAKTTVRDCTFAKNRCADQWGRGASGEINATGCIFSGCDFDDEYSYRYAKIFEVGGSGAGLVLSNCVVRNMTRGDTQMTRLFGLKAAGLTNSLCVFTDNNVCSIYTSDNASQCGMLFDRCLYESGTYYSSDRGLVDLKNEKAATSANSGVRVTFRECLFRTNRIDSLVTASLGGTAEKQIVVDACTFADTKLSGGALFDVSQSASSVSGTAFQELVDVRNTCFANCYYGTSARAPFQSNWGTDYAASIANCACSCADSVMAANASNLTSVNPKFKDAANGNYMPRISSPLREKGVMSDWMTADAMDLGEGFEYETGVYTIHPCGETHQVGATVAIKNPRPRVIRDVPDIGACEYQPNGLGLMLLVR